MPFAKAYARSFGPKARSFRDPEHPTSCDGVYAYAVEKGCLVGCGYDQDCAAACFADTVAQFPADPICKPQDQEDPCQACKTGCVEFGDHWIQENCQQACPNGEEWGNDDCASCMNAGFCIRGACAEAICREPCGELGEDGGEFTGLARHKMNKLAPRRTPTLARRNTRNTRNTRNNLARPALARPALARPAGVRRANPLFLRP